MSIFFMCLFGLYNLWWVPGQEFCPFLNWVVCFLMLSFKGSLYVLDTSCELNMCFANMFSQSVACLFTLLTVSFTEQMFLIFMKSNLSIFLFVDLLVACLRTLPNPRSRKFSPSKSFFLKIIVLHLDLLHLIHFGYYLYEVWDIGEG